MSVSSRVVGRADIAALAILLLSISLAANRTAEAQSNGALGNALSAASLARGGIMAAEQGDPLEAVEGNPAGLAGLGKPTLEFSSWAVFTHGSFANSVNADGTLRSFAGVIPYAAFGVPLGAGKWRAAIALTPDMLLRASWHYADPPGFAGVTYGVQKNESEIVALRSSVSIARSFGSRWLVGAGVGLVYNTNTLHAPYIFQQQPRLAGLKVLVDLKSRGFGWNGNAGLQWQPSSLVRFGLAWKSSTYIQSHGDLNGSASALFTALGIDADPGFHYLAEVDNHLPQTAVAAVRWQAGRQTVLSPAVLSFEGSWTGWAGAFQNLPLKLKDGTNATINSVAGSPSIRDEVALHWRDQGTFRAGVEVPLKKQWSGRAGYSYASNPVPDTTLTPLTAAILTNSFSAGVGYAPGSSQSQASSAINAATSPWAISAWRWDIAYQVQLPAAATVGQSALLAGEYDDSRVQVLTQSVAISARYTF